MLAVLAVTYLGVGLFVTVRVSAPNRQPAERTPADAGLAYREASFEAIGAYFVERLKTVFEGVAENPLPLRNSMNVPIYLLCFAAANPKGAPPAVRIANHILRP